MPPPPPPPPKKSSLTFEPPPPPPPPPTTQILLRGPCVSCKMKSSIEYQIWLYDVKTALLCNPADFHSFQVGMRNESSELSLYCKTMYLFKYCYSINTYCSLLLSTVMYCDSTRVSLASLLSKCFIPLATSEAICSSSLSVSLDHMIVYGGSCLMHLWTWLLCSNLTRLPPGTNSTTTHKSSIGVNAGLHVKEIQVCT